MYGIQPATACLILASLGVAQLPTTHEIYLISSSQAGFVGDVVSKAGDIDGDGLGDFVDRGSGVGAPYHMIVWGGQDGQVLLDIQTQDYIWAVGSAGDVDGDGTPDLLLGMPDGANYAGYVDVVSGKDGSILLTLNADPTIYPRQASFGEAVAGAGDVDGDGYADVIVGAPGGNYPDQGYAQVFSGKSGALLQTFLGSIPRGRFGTAVNSAGDVNGDGVPDLVVGAPGPFYHYPGNVYVYSGSDGSLQWRVVGQGTFIASYGNAVAPTGDLDGDGVGDLVVGDAEFGLAEVLSGRNGKAIHTWRGVQSFANTVDGIGDVDGDGVGDVAVSQYSPSATPTVFVFSGQSGVKLYEWHGDESLALEKVSAAGDVNGDGIPDMVVGMPRRLQGGVQTGGVLVLSGRPLPLRSDRYELSLASGGTQTLSLDGGAGAAGTPYWLLGSASGIRPGLALGGVTLPLVADAYLIQTALFPNTLPLGQSMGALDGAGQATATFTVPPGLPPALLGLTLDHAFVSYTNASTFTFASNAVPITLVQ